MPRSYRHIKDYELEIEKLREEGYTSREIGNKLGFSYKQMRNYYYRSNVAERKIQAGISLKRKGRPPKDYVVCHPNKNGHRKASKNGMNRILSFVFERRPHLFHGSLDNEPLPT